MFASVDVSAMGALPPIAPLSDSSAAMAATAATALPSSELPVGWPSWLPHPTRAELAGSTALFGLLKRAGSSGGSSSGGSSSGDGGGGGDGNSDGVTVEVVVDLVREVAGTLLPSDRPEGSDLSEAEFARLLHAVRCLASAPCEAAQLVAAAERVRPESVGTPVVTPASKARAKAEAEAAAAAEMLAAAEEAEAAAAKAKAAAQARATQAQVAANEAQAEAAAKAFKSAMEAETAASEREAAAKERARAADAEASALARAKAGAAEVRAAAASNSAAAAAAAAAATTAMPPPPPPSTHGHSNHMVPPMGSLNTPRAMGVSTLQTPAGAATGGLPTAFTNSAVAPPSAVLAATPSVRLPPPTEVHRQRYGQIFNVLHTQRELAGVTREKGFSVLKKSGLQDAVLERVWTLADVDGDGVLDHEEFVLAMHLTNAKVKMQVELPERLPAELIPPGKQLPPLR